MGLLQRPGPDIDVAQLGVLAVEAEHLRPRPGLHDEVVRLVVLLAQRGRRLPVAEVGVHTGAHREAGHQPPAAEAVQHGELLRHADGRVVEGDGVAQHHQRRPRGAPRQGGGHQVGRGHEAVGVLVVLVDAQAVKAHLLGELQFVQVFVVQFVAADGVEQLRGRVHPHRAVALGEVRRQEAVRHQVEPVEVHRLSSLPVWPMRSGRVPRLVE